ncbi:hypothetical protein ACIPWL_10075 [Streptomyces sp. NPDC090023]|uniref:hypothetical protein n=1 Tax=unclassified Streptomyces TaxID=2593676 RepID=UPI00380F8154
MLDSDAKRSHVGSTLGRFEEAEIGPTYPMQHGGRRVWVERMWDEGAWTGPDEGRPERAPDWLTAICQCGWNAQTLVPRDRAGAPDSLREQRAAEGHPLATDALTGEDLARAYWLAHALAATSSALPQGATAALQDTRGWLTTLAHRQPHAAIRMAAVLREQANEAERVAVGRARGLDTPWEDIARAAGIAKQPMWRKHRGVSPAVSRDEISPSTLPQYQHEDGHPPYTIEHIPPTDN